jgi:hypothetical protein
MAHSVVVRVVERRPLFKMLPHRHGGCQAWRSVANRSEEQRRRYHRWLAPLRGKRLAVIELGAGTTVPTVRREWGRRGGWLIRVNPRETDAPVIIVLKGRGAHTTGFASFSKPSMSAIPTPGPVGTARLPRRDCNGGANQSRYFSIPRLYS